MRWLVAELHGARELVDALDFSRLLRVHEQSVSSDARGLHRHANDMVWRAPFRDRNEDDDDAWLYLVVMLEFQSEVDFLMPLRIRNYVDNFHMERWRGKRFRSTDRLAPVLPIVLYTGTSPWSAPPRVIDLVTPGASGAGRGEAGVASRANPLFAGDGYLALDTLRVAADDLRHDNAAALLAGLENPSPSRIAGQVTALHRRLRAPELAPLREVMLLWAQQVARRRIGLDLEIRDMAEMDRLHESGDLEEYFAVRVRAWQDEYRAEGRAQHRAGHRAGYRTGHCRGAGPATPAGGTQVRRRHGRAIGGSARADQRYPPSCGSGGLDHRLHDGRRSDCPLRQRRRAQFVKLEVQPRTGLVIPLYKNPASSIPRPAKRARGYGRHRSSGLPTRAGRWAPSQAAGSPASLRSQRAQRSRRCTAAETSYRSTSTALSAGRVSYYRRSATTALRPVLPRSGLREHTGSGGNVHPARDQRFEGRRVAGVHPHKFCPFGQTGPR